MCNEIRRGFNLSDDIRIEGMVNSFSLVIRGNAILHNCNNFSYINGKLFITKSGDTIYVFSTEVCQENNRYTLKLMATIKYLSPNLYAKIKLDGVTYLVNSNCKVTFSDYPK